MISSSTRSWLQTLLGNRFVFRILLAAGLAQAVGAVGTVFLADAVTHTHDASGLVNSLFVFFICVSFAYLPDLWVGVSYQRWQIELMVWLRDGFLQRYGAKCYLWQNRQVKETVQPFLVGEAQAVLEGAASYFLNLGLFCLSFLFGLGAIVWLLDSWFLAFYIFLLVLGMSSARIVMPKLERLAELRQKSRVRYDQSLLKIWDSVVLGNIYSHRLWLASNKNRVSRLEKISLKQEIHQRFFENGVAVIFKLLLFLALAMSIHLHGADYEYLSVLVITIPKQLQLVQLLADSVEYWAEWGNLKGELAGLEKNISDKHFAREHHVVTNTEKELQDRIKWNGIVLLNSNTVSTPLTLEQVIGQTVERGPGRYQIAAGNGVGKTSLLLSLKQFLGDDALMVPAVHDLTVRRNLAELSTGQRQFGALEEFAEKCPQKVWLLDEWDSHMDAEARSTMNARLNQLAGKICIVEAAVAGRR